jgi:hypothetical protein
MATGIWGEVVPIVEEVPPILQDWFITGECNDFQLLQRAFNIEFHFKEETTTYFKLLISITNTNLERNKVGKSKRYASRCTPVDEETMWKFFGAYMIKQLQTNGRAQEVGWGGVNIHETFIGKNRYKVSPISIQLFCEKLI